MNAAGSLTPEQVEQFRSAGYVNRIPILTADELATHRAFLDEVIAKQEEANGGEWTDRSYRPWDHDSHPLADWVRELALDQRILDAVTSVLGPDILIRNADVFWKTPGLRRGIGWHVDTAVTSEDADRLITAWLGLTPSTRENGGLEFSRGTHQRILPDGPKDRWHLTLSKEAASHLDPADAAFNAMEAGEMSLHHFRLVHRSMGNTTREPRIGFVVRFMATSISAETAESGIATLARGEDRFGHFQLRDRFPLSWI